MTIPSTAETAKAYAASLQPYFRRLSEYKMHSKSELDEFIESFLTAGTETTIFRQFNSALDAFLNLPFADSQDLGRQISGRILSECFGEALTKHILHNFSALDAVALADIAAQGAGIKLANDSLVFQENIFRRLLTFYIAGKCSSREIVSAGKLLLLPLEKGKLPNLPSVRCGGVFIPVSSTDQEKSVKAELSEAVVLRRIFANVSGRLLERNADGTFTVVPSGTQSENVYLSTTLDGLIREIKPQSLCVSKNWLNSDIFKTEVLSLLKEQRMAVLLPVEYTPHALPYIELMFADLAPAAALIQKLGCCKLRFLGSAAGSFVIFGQCK